MSNIEDFLTAILNDEHLTAVDIISRMDKYLKACCTGEGCEGLPQPQTRADVLLYELAEKLSHGSGGAGYVDTKKLDSMANFSAGNKNLDFISDENFDTSNVQYFDKAFQYCTNLITAPVMNTSKAVSMSYMFDGCTKLKTVHELNCNLCWAFYDAFKNCTALENLTFTEGTIQSDIDFSTCISLSRNSLLSILKGIKKTMGYKRLKLPVSFQQTILDDEELNEEYNAVLDAHWYVDFI